MVMKFADVWLERLGFTKYDPPKEITGTCYIVRIYQINGIQIENNEQIIDSFNKKTKFGIGSNINDLCLSLFDNTLKDIEEQIKEARPPYLVTVTTDHEKYTNRCEWITESYENLATWDCFQQEQGNVIKLVNKYEKICFLIVCCALSSSDKAVTGKLIHENTFWIMPDGECFQDVLLGFSGEIESIKKIDLSERKKNLKALIQKSRLLEDSISKLLFRSMQEDDKIIKFLFSWTALEKLINKTFKKNPETPSEFPPDDKIPVEYKKIVSQLYSDPTRGRKITSIGQKFVYLSNFYWNFRGSDL